MLYNYFKIALRHLTRHRGYSALNITGLATGMAVAVLIGLWLHDEWSFDKYHANYGRIAQLMQHETMNGVVTTQFQMPYPMRAGLLESYGSDFKYVVTTTSVRGRMLTAGDKALLKEGAYMGPDAPYLFSLRMLRGTRAGLQDPHSVLLSASVAEAFFGAADPLGKPMKIDNKQDVVVTGVYEDLPPSTTFSNLSFVAPLALFVSTETWVKQVENSWDSRAFGMFVQLADHAGAEQVSAKIKHIRRAKMDPAQAPIAKPEVFLHPMSRWHLYSEFKDGVNTGGAISFVRLFALIGAFVLLLACINFMNLSTARSAMRAREVGIRKVAGSGRWQLVGQFYGESLLLVALSFGLCLVLVSAALPFFNELAGKKMAIPWGNPYFWLSSMGFCLLTAGVAGSYPALYLSSFRPVSVLKGTFRAGRLAALPRKVLVVVQFAVSIALIIGTLVVFRQIEYARARPAGYSRAGLLGLPMTTKAIHAHFEAFRDELKKTGAVAEVAESNSPLSQVWNTTAYIGWKGKDPSQAADVQTVGVSGEYAQTLGWELKAGRFFVKTRRTDYNAFVLNEAAAKLAGMKNPVGETLKWGEKDYTVIGVIRDVIVESPFAPVRPAVFFLSSQQDADAYPMHFFFLKINPAVSPARALPVIERVFKKYSPATPFDYKFMDEEYGKKFSAEERVGKLARVFAGLAIFISCLGLFGLASFVAEQRTREIGIRKVLGASVFNLWGLLSRDFVGLVVVAFGVAAPLAYYFLSGWLGQYAYRTGIPGWIFVASGTGALGVTLLTVSFQAIRAALANPVKSLRAE